MTARLMLMSMLMVGASLCSSSAGAQGAAELVARGDSAYEARRAREALADYERALALEPRDFAALWRASRTGVDLGEFDSDEARRAALYRTAAERARLAVQVDSSAANGHFALAKALGRTALSVGKRDQVRFAGAVRNEALRCLALERGHAGCLHILGMWNAEVMRLSGLTRMLARNFLGGGVFDEASWANARRYMEAAVNAEPRRIVHRLDLAGVYADMGMTAAARTQYEAVVNGEVLDYNDPEYKAEAAARLRRLSER